MRQRRAMRAALLAAIASLPFVSYGAAATTASASPAPITIAYITDVTGQARPRTGIAGWDSRHGSTSRMRKGV